MDVKILPPFMQSAGRIYQEIQLPQGDIVAFTLSDGCQLIYCFSDKTPNHVYFKAFCRGGNRTLAMTDFHTLHAAISIADESGVQGLPPDRLAQAFRHTPFCLATFFDEAHQGIMGSCQSTYLPQLLHLFRLKLSQPRICPEVLAHYQHAMLQRLKTPSKAKEFDRLVAQSRHLSHFATCDSAENINALSAERLLQAYQHYLGGQTDFTYLIVGDIEKSQVMKLAERYLANLVAKRKRQPLPITPAIVPNSPIFMQGNEQNRSEVALYFLCDEIWQPQQVYLLELLAEIVEKQLSYHLKAQESQLHGLEMVITQAVEHPQIEGKLHFSCPPDCHARLLEAVHQWFDEFIHKGVEPMWIATTLIQKNQQVARQFDSLLGLFSLLDESYTQTQSEMLMYPDLYAKTVSKAKLDDLAGKLFCRQARFEAVFMP